MHKGTEGSCVGEVVAAIDALLRTTSGHQQHIKWLCQDWNAPKSRSQLKDLLVSHGYNVIKCTSDEKGRSGGKANHSLGHTFLVCLPDGEHRIPWPFRMCMTHRCTSTFGQTCTMGGTQERPGNINDVACHFPTGVGSHLWRCLHLVKDTSAIVSACHAGRLLEPLIVDPDFRGQFEMAKQTQDYQAVMAVVPKVCVGTEQRVQQLVKLLCREMHRTFLEQGSSIPPWRSCESFLAKWHLPKAVPRLSRTSESSMLTPVLQANSTVKAAWRLPPMHAGHPIAVRLGSQASSDGSIAEPSFG